MVYYSDAPLDTTEKDYRITKLTSEIVNAYPTIYGDKYDKFIDPSGKDIKHPLKRATKFLLTNLLSHTRWSCTSDVVRYSSNDKLVFWFITTPLKQLIDECIFKGDTLIQRVQEYEFMKFDDTNKFNKDIIDTFVGYQRFFTKMSSPRFIPGIMNSGYHIFTDSQIHHDILWYFTYEFKKFNQFLYRYMIDASAPKDPDNPEDWVKLTPEVEIARDYIRGFSYPDPNGEMSDNEFKLPATYFDYRSTATETQKKYKIWMMLVAFKYYLDKVPGKVKYKTKPMKYKNQALRKAIVDSLYFKGLASNMKRNSEAEQAVTHVIDEHFDNYPLPVKRDYEDYKRLIDMLLNDYSGYCDTLLYKWKFFEDLIVNDWDSFANPSSNTVAKAKSIIMWMTLLDMITRCQRDLMFKFDSNKDLLYATSIFYNYSNNKELDRFFECDNGIYDLKEYDNIRLTMLDFMHRALNDMVPKETLRQIMPRIKSFKYHILQRKWLTHRVNTFELTDSNLMEIQECAVKIALYIIRIFGGCIPNACIPYDINGISRPLMAPVFGRRMTD